MTDPATTPAAIPVPGAAEEGSARLWRGYFALCVLCWLLYAMAGTEWDRGAWRLWDGIYEATFNLGPPIVLGAFVLPWVRWLQRRWGESSATIAWHIVGAIVFVVAWQLIDFVVAWSLFGADHATATFQQRVLWRAMWGVFAYFALVSGFASSLHARRAHRVAIAAARAEAALVRAELANISGKLNPHFLFNTLNSLLILTRKDPAAAEQALLRFSRMMRYVLDTTRSATDRVALEDELAFVRDYLALESLRLGSRLKVDWQHRSGDARRRDPAADAAAAGREQHRPRHRAADRRRHGADRVAPPRRSRSARADGRRRRRRLPLAARAPAAPAASA